MKTQLVILEDYNIIVRDEKEKVELNILYYEAKNTIPIYDFTKHTLPNEYYLQRVIASTSPKHNLLSIDYNGLEEKYGIVDVEEIAESAYGIPINNNAKRRVEGFIDGFKASQSLNDKKFSLEDMYMLSYHIVNSVAANVDNSDWRMKTTPKMLANNYIRLLQQPKVFDVEGIVENDTFKILK